MRMVSTQEAMNRIAELVVSGGGLVPPQTSNVQVVFCDSNATMPAGVVADGTINKPFGRTIEAFNWAVENGVTDLHIVYGPRHQDWTGGIPLPYKVPSTITSLYMGCLGAWDNEQRIRPLDFVDATNISTIQMVDVKAPQCTFVTEGVFVGYWGGMYGGIARKFGDLGQVVCYFDGLLVTQAQLTALQDTDVFLCLGGVYVLDTGYKHEFGFLSWEDGVDYVAIGAEAVYISKLPTDPDSATNKAYVDAKVFGNEVGNSTRGPFTTSQVPPASASSSLSPNLGNLPPGKYLIMWAANARTDVGPNRGGFVRIGYGQNPTDIVYNQYHCGCDLVQIGPATYKERRTAISGFGTFEVLEGQTGNYFLWVNASLRDAASLGTLTVDNIRISWWRYE